MSKTWQLHQARYYTRIGSRRTSLRWATAVIHKLLLVSWDLWQYRNDRLHSAAWPRDLALHHSLNDQIDSEFALGSASLEESSRYLIDSRSQATLRGSSIDAKRNWLSSVTAARTAFGAQLAATPPAREPAQFTEQAIRFMAHFGVSAPSLAS